MFKKDNNSEDMKTDFHIADNDYKDLKPPKLEPTSNKEVIAQLQQSSLPPTEQDNASLYPFHIHLAQADTPMIPQAEEDNSASQGADQTQDQEVTIEMDIDEVMEDESPAPEDPGVMLLPDTAEEVIKIELRLEKPFIVEDDGSQELYRIKHNNNGLVQDEPRDLGIPPVEYPLQKTFFPFIPSQQVASEECCSHQVEINITAKLLYLGEYCCYGGGESEAGFSAFSSNYGWGEGGCGCDCGPYIPPPPPTPNYSIVFNSCDGEQWLDITICNTGYGETYRSSNYQFESDSNYEDCCTTYRIEIPASLGLDCDCPILTLETDQLFIRSPWDLIKSDSHFIDCHGDCFELTYSDSSGSGFSTYIAFDEGPSSSEFVLQPCECDYEYINISAVDEPCYSSGSAENYYFEFAFTSSDVDCDGVIDTFLTFDLYNYNYNDYENFYSTAQIEIPAGLGIDCSCPIEDFVYNRSDWISYVDDVTNYGSSDLTATQALEFFTDNGLFTDCEDNCFELDTTPVDPEVTTGAFSFILAECDDCTHVDLDITFSCNLVDRFDSWVANVAPGSFDPFQFFIDNVHATLVDCNNTSYLEIQYTGIDGSLGDGYYSTYEDSIKIDLPANFCVDNFNELVIDPKAIYEAYQNSCYQFGYDLYDVLDDLLYYGDAHVLNTKSGAEFEFINDCSYSYSYELAPASCEDAICLNPVNTLCYEEVQPALFANFNQDAGYCGGECETVYSYYTEGYGLIEFDFSFVKGEYDTRINFNYSVDGDSGTFAVLATDVGLGCTNPIENIVFDETDLINYINEYTLLHGDITGLDVFNFFTTNGMFESCEGDCLEIKQTGEGGDFPWILQNCTDCTHTPITVSIDDCCNEAMIFLVDPSEQTDADKLAYFQNLLNLEYVNCNGASFVEFTYYYNNSYENCQYDSFPVCSDSVRITVPEYFEGYGCRGESSSSFDISEILPNNNDISSLISHLALDCNFIGNFFNDYFTDYCGDISYNIPQYWGSEFLRYLENSNSVLTTESGICYELVQNECGDYVLDLAFSPEVLSVNQNSYETNFLIVDCKDCCDSQAFLLGLGDQDEYSDNELFSGDKIYLPSDYNCNDCQIDLCSLDYNYDEGNVTGFHFMVNCDEDCFDFQYTGTDANGTWSITPCADYAPVVLDLTGQGIDLTHAAKDGVQYDVTGDGVKDSVGWIGSGNGLLIYDANNDNTVTDSSEFVLTDHVPGAKTDMEALRIGFDTNHDNALDQQDAVWNQFGVWQDANNDAIVDNGEYHSLAQLGIVSISLATQGADQMVNGNIIHGTSSFAFADGSTGTVADVAFRYIDGVDSVHNNTTVTDPAVSNPTVAEQSQVMVAQNDAVVQSALNQMQHQAEVTV